MLIRRAEPGDLARVGDLTVAAYASFTLGDDDPYIARLRDAASRAEQAELWVAADDDGRVVGSVTSCPVGSPWREIAYHDEGEFRMLAVDPAAQRAGAGRALVEHVVERWRAAGVRGIAISSLDAMTGAHTLYDRLGFVREPARDWSPEPDVQLFAFTRTFPQTPEEPSWTNP